MKRITLFVAIFIVAINIGCFSGSETIPDYSRWESKEIFSVEKLCDKNFLMFRTAFRSPRGDEIVQVALRPVLLGVNKVTEEEKESARKKSEWWLTIAKKRDSNSWLAVTYKSKRIFFISRLSLIDNRTIRRIEFSTDYINFLKSLAEKELCSNSLVASIPH